MQKHSSCQTFYSHLLEYYYTKSRVTKVYMAHFGTTNIAAALVCALAKVWKE
jgi:hypothetical protein